MEEDDYENSNSDMSSDPYEPYVMEDTLYESMKRKNKPNIKEN